MCVIFMVEDDPAVRVTAERILRRAGHEVLTATSVDEALSVIESDKSFDVLFTDMALGEHALGGMQLARRAAAARPGMPVLCTSGGVISGEAQKIFSEANAFLPKPYSMAGLLHALASIVPQSTSARVQ